MSRWWPRLAPVSAWFLAPLAVIRSFVRSVICGDKDNNNDKSSIDCLMAVHMQNWHEKEVEIADTDVKDIMTHRNETAALDMAGGREVIMNAITNYCASNGLFRNAIPVCDGNIDVICGYVTMADLIEFMVSDARMFPWNRKMREILFVAPSMSVVDLFARMKKTGTYIAVVLDEYGGTDGIIFLDNILELLVGDTENVVVSGMQFDVSGRVEIETLEERLGIELTDEDTPEDLETLGGLILFMLGHVPTVGETVTHKSGLVFIIKEAGAKSISKVTIDRTNVRH